MRRRASASFHARDDQRRRRCGRRRAEGCGCGCPGVLGRPDGQAAFPIVTTGIDAAGFDCQTCGACCAYSADWPRFSTESDAELDRIPPEFVAADESGMRCEGDRCSALGGAIGVAASCLIHAVRPAVCRTCMPGDVECAMARRRHGLPILVDVAVFDEDQR